MSFNLSLNGIPDVSGLTYQWQRSSDNVSWTDLSGSTSTTRTTTASGPYYYRNVVTCANSGLSTPSTAVQVVPNTACVNIYNGSIITCTSTFYDNGGAGGSTDFGSGSTGNYTDNLIRTLTIYPATPGSVVSVTFNSFATELGYDTLTVYNGAAANANALAKIHGGGKDILGISTPIRNGGTNTTLATLTFFSTAADGSLSFRFRSDGDINYAGWNATVTCLSQCSGTPVAGTTVSSPNPVCSGSSFMLSLAGSTANNGIGYQWETSPDGSTWTPVLGATNATFTTSQTAPTFYHAIVSCSFSNLSATSTSVEVTMSPFYVCYPAPTSGGDECISNVSIGTINNSTPGCSAGNYSLQSATGVLYVGGTHNLSVSTDGNAITSVWIDYNQNGAFDATEWTQVYTNGTTGSAAVTIPANALTGNTGMRIRSRGAGNTNGANDAQTAFASGETEDYVVELQPLPPCAGTPAPGNTLANPAVVCTGASFQLSVSNPVN
ncbi:MAG TPA: GEVED domain-containing protein, partial [Hymenobacter sp.]|nr:GEVED domain-containing protein [Hymenobacter sp.]